MDGSLLEGVDAMITQFELNWEESMSGSEVLSYLNSWPPEIVRSGCLELLFSDVDRRMRYRSEAMEASANGEQGFNLEFKFPFDVDFYLNNFLNTNEERESLRHYLQCMRINFGDCPKVSEDETRKIQSEFDLDYPRLTVFEKSSAAFSADFSGQLMIGRQELSEPKPYAMVNVKNAGQKLIFSPVSDADVSRKQVAIQFCSRNLVSIANSSTNRAFGILGNGPKRQNIVVAPGDSVFVVLPAMLVLGSKIQIHRRD